MRVFTDYINGSNRPGIKMTPKYVVIHNTANTNPQAGAKVHRDYAEINDRGASYHWSVDDREAYAIIPEDEMAWHAGDGRYGEGNRYGIGIEVCESGDFDKTYKNAVKLAAERLKENNLSIDRLKKHQDFSGKYCPRKLIPIWDKFKSDVKKEMEGDRVKYFSNGDSGQGVKLLQEDLKELGYDLSVDGKYGPETEKTIRKFQTDNKLQIDGMAGPETLGKIDKLLSNDNQAIKELENRVKTIEDKLSKIEKVLE